jgi:hypothetical protein
MQWIIDSACHVSLPNNARWKSAYVHTHTLFHLFFSFTFVRPRFGCQKYAMPEKLESVFSGSFSAELCSFFILIYLFTKNSQRSCVVFSFWSVWLPINGSNLTIINKIIYQNTCLDFITIVKIKMSHSDFSTKISAEAARLRNWGVINLGSETISLWKIIISKSEKNSFMDD